MVDIEFVATAEQLVVHVESHHHGDIHIDELGGEVEVALEVASIYDIEDDVWVFLDDVLAYVEFLRRIGAEAISSGEVDKVECVSTMVECADLLVDGNATVVADSFMCMGSDVEYTGFSTVGIADKGNIDCFEGIWLYCASW